MKEEQQLGARNLKKFISFLVIQTKLLKAWVGWGLLYGPNPALHSYFVLEGCEGVGRERLWEKPVPQSDGQEKQKINCGTTFRVQELCESRGGRPGLSILTSLLVSVDVKQY